MNDSSSLPLLLGLAALAFAAAAVFLWRYGGRRRHRDDAYRRRSPDEVMDPTGATGLQVGEMRRKLSDVQRTLDRHAEQVQALRTEAWRRLDDLEGRVRDVERRASASAAPARPARDPWPEPRPEPARPAFPGVETYGVMLQDPAPSWNPGASGRPVEVREGVLVISHSLPPAAYAVPEGTGRARVFLNESVEINEFALPKWQAFFDMRGARPYATYRTVRPAEVAWDAAAERGTPLHRGEAEAV